jgi:hypothetical protein
MTTKSRSLILGERDAIVSFLRKKSAEYLRMACVVLSDSSQNRLEADRWDACSKAMEEASLQISDEMHWK